MNLVKSHYLFASLVLCGILSAAPSAASKPGAKRPTVADTGKAPSPAVVPPPPIPVGAKVVRYDPKDVIRVKAKLRYTTLIVLPENEQILDFTCGDKEFWVVNGNENFAHVKPAKAGAETNLNLITASGNVYSFVLADVSEIPNAEPDLKVFVESQTDGSAATPAITPKFVSAQVVEDYRQQVELAKEETRQVREGCQAAVDSGISRFLSNVRFPYRFDAGKKPFFIRAMYHDDKFMYIQARPEETPTLYEMKDGKPNLVNFEYKNGLYVADKILDRGYLTIGKHKLGFERQD